MGHTLTERAHVKSSGSNDLEGREKGVITPIHVNIVAERVSSRDLVDRAT